MTGHLFIDEDVMIAMEYGEHIIQLKCQAIDNRVDRLIGEVQIG